MLRKIVGMTLLVVVSLLVAVPDAHAAGWLLRCGNLCDAWGCYYVCALVWWPYYEHLTTEPDWCMWQNGDTVWLKYNAQSQIIGWYGVPNGDQTTQAPSGYAPHNWTVVGVQDGAPCSITP